MMMMMTYQDGIPMKGGGAGPCPLPSVVRHLVAVSGGASPTPSPASGRWAVNVAPYPSTLSMVSRPPWRSRMCLTSASPSLPSSTLISIPYRCSNGPDGLLLPWIAVWQFWHERPNVSTDRGPLVRPP